MTNKRAMLSEILAGVISIESRLREQARGPLMAEHTRRELDLLRTERVKLQGENESLRHDLEVALAGGKVDERFTYSGATGDTRTEVKGSFPEAEITALHKRIDQVAEIIGARLSHFAADLDDVNRCIGALQGQMAGYIGLDGDEGAMPGGLSLVERVTTLEQLAEQRGERLDDLERRQEQDDLDRATGDGMPEPPLRDDLPGTGMDPEPDQTPTHVNGLRFHDTDLLDTYGPGDDIRLEGAVSEGGHRIEDGWYTCRGVAAREWAVQIGRVNARFAETLLWTKPEYVKEVRHAQR